MTAPKVPAKLITLMGSAAAVAMFAQTIRGFEGHKNVGYLDIVGVPTACDGITGHGIKVGEVYTDEQCDAWFYEEATSKIQAVVTCTPILAGRGQLLIAAGSLAYNIGTAGYCKSSVRRYFNAYQWVAACNAFPLYRMAGGCVSKGLVRRRAKERQLCLSAVRGLQ